mmetsp:Transcript_30934/g.34503  ORF Transcript_30934/g.34503 Transcript_30934/m.34503 type:complete len:223 (+) Transcript_30934:70-738(+)
MADIIKRFFGQTPKAPSVQDAMAYISATLEMLEKKVTYLEKKQDACTTEATALLAKNQKAKALLCIKRRRMYAASLKQLENAQTNLEFEKFALENAQVVGEILKAIELGTATLKALNDGLGDAETIMEEAQEQRDIANETFELMSEFTPACLDGYDSDELLADFKAEIEQDNVVMQQDVSNLVQHDLSEMFPTPPRNVNQQESKQTETEDAFAQLNEWAQAN